MTKKNAIKKEYLSFKYEQGKPTDLVVNELKLSGQDGWESVKNGDLPVISSAYAKTGKQSVYKGMSGSISYLHRKVSDIDRQGMLKVSAYLFYSDGPSWNNDSNTVSLLLEDIKGQLLFEFGITRYCENASFFTRVNDKIQNSKTYYKPYKLKNGWYWIQAIMDIPNNLIVSVNATVIYPGLVPASCWEIVNILNEPTVFDSNSSNNGIGYIGICMGDDTAVDDIVIGKESIDFETPRYSMKGTLLVSNIIRKHEKIFEKIQGNIYIYCTFDMILKNPMPCINAIQNGIQTVTVGCFDSGNFIPAISFGMNDGRNLGKGYLTAWIFDGNQNYYDDYIRPETPYDFKIKIDTENNTLNAWCVGRGEDDWRLIIENKKISISIKGIDAVIVEQYPGSADISKFIVSNKKTIYETMQRHPLEKANRYVKEGMGYRYQPMRSIWRKPGKQVIIGRNSARWLGFPTVVQTDKNTLVCAHNEGTGHGGGGGMFVRHSYDLGKTWSDALMVHPNAINSPRLQKLKDGSLLLLADTYDSYNHMSEGSRYSIVFYSSYDGGKTWINQRWLDPRIAGGNETCVPSSVLELKDGSWLIAGSHFPEGISKAWISDQGEQLEFYRSNDQGYTWHLHSIYKPPFPFSIGEPSLLSRNDRLIMYMRENCVTFHGHKAFSTDNGKTWVLDELPFYVIGRVCADFLRNGKVMLTTRSPIPGRASLGAWISEYDDNEHFSFLGTHFNDSYSIGLKDDGLHIDNDGRCGQFTQYSMRYPDSPDSTIDIKFNVKVLSNDGYAATVSLPYVGKMRIYPDKAMLLSDDEQILINPLIEGQSHDYHIKHNKNKTDIYIDDKLIFDINKASDHYIRMPWTPAIISIYPFTFGNEDTKPAGTADFYADKYMHKNVSGYSIWKNFEATTEDQKTGIHFISWNANKGFPDQYQLDHMIEIDASICGIDQGYSGWVELEDGRIFVVNYTDDLAPSLNGLCGLSYIRGSFIDLSDIQ